MNRRLKKISMLSMLLALFVSLFTACSQSNTTNNVSPTASADSAGSPAPTSSESGKGAGDLKGKVVFWSMWSSSEPQAKVIESAIADFNAANPEVTVEVKFNGRDLFKLIKPSLDGGEQVDIWEGDPSGGGGLATLTEHVLKLDDLISDNAIGMEGSVKDSIQPSLMNWVHSLSSSVGLEEGIYAIPHQPNAVLFFYNKEVYEKAGVTTVPTTWDEFLAVSDLIKKSGVAPITFDDAYRDLFIGGYLSSAMGSDWVDQLVKDKTGEMWNDPMIHQFANDIVMMREKGYFSEKIAGSKYPAAQQDLVLGQSATYLNGTWLPNEVSNTAGPDFRWGSFQFPDVPNGNGKGGQQGLTFGSQSIFMNKNSENIPAAFELVKYLASRKAQEGMVKEALAIPATIDTEWPDTLKEAAVAFENAKVNLPWGGGINNAGDFASVSIIPVFMELVTGKINAEQYVTKMIEAAKKYHAGA
ncbi:ABC transporter substrate-binding protein [Paenibacillus sp. PAMC21692]|uniref:ABC transporter substrate-binding protein n=1 Tax=Paenibacillus sp. PAMC21692 TaxID=2762320 RepID=UPI00164E5B13|nr:extracellular solute-binding protein [Paenibacillus sp. PAMC21692]QNK57944.1 extracellular solute-binding protein [Paenibacillus sp. PAMC21692]